MERMKSGSRVKLQVVKRFGLEIHPSVFLVSVGLIVLFVTLSLFYLEVLGETFSRLQNLISLKAGWFYIGTVNLILLFVIALFFTRFGHIRIGGPTAKTDFSTWSWLTMLFSAGMGIGLLFYSVAEPMYHYIAPPFGEAGNVEAAQRAMNLTFYHWGRHAWGIYAVVALALAYGAYNRGLPMTIRSVFYPILGDRIHGWLGNTIDILAVVATLFGVATSLGLGVQQINAGLAYLFDAPQAATVQVALIGGITALATISVVLGLDRGIRRLSEFNMTMAIILLTFVLVAGPTVFLLNGLIQNTGSYLQRILELSTWTATYRDTDWQSSWTIFYWAWWIAWSPFVGMFIARVSKGRTIREFLLCVLLVPTAFTFLWLTIFGNSALYEELFREGGIAVIVQENLPLALFVLLDRFPFAAISSFIVVVVVITFFVTSSDSGSLVIDIITAGGGTNPPVAQRIFWAITEGVVAAVLLLGGGLTALQTGAILSGLPFAVVLLCMCYSLYKGLKSDRGR
jgi:choline/glycine/proline betaine transport protein